MDRASDYGSEGWEFESLQLRHFKFKRIVKIIRSKILKTLFLHPLLLKILNVAKG
jgi:hypothetical protein